MAPGHVIELRNFVSLGAQEKKIVAIMLRPSRPDYGLAGGLFVTAGFAPAAEPHVALAISQTPRTNRATIIHAAIDSNMVRAAPPRAVIWFLPTRSCQL